MKPRWLMSTWGQGVMHVYQTDKSTGAVLDQDGTRHWNVAVSVRGIGPLTIADRTSKPINYSKRIVSTLIQKLEAR